MNEDSVSTVINRRQLQIPHPGANACPPTHPKAVSTLLWFVKAFAVCLLRWSTPISYLASIFPGTEAVYQIISKAICLQAGPLRNPPLSPSKNVTLIFYVDKQANFGTLQNRMLPMFPFLE